MESRKAIKASMRSSYRSHFKKERRSRGGARTPTRPGFWFETTVGGQRIRVSDKAHGNKVQRAARIKPKP